MKIYDSRLLEKYEYYSRFIKAQKIEIILKDFLQLSDDSLHRLKCLDVGCAIGVITARLAEIFGQVIGVDPSEEAIYLARNLHRDSSALFMQGDGLHLPFVDASFDVVVCAQVYEHSSVPELLAEEIWRVLVPGGSCFFSGPNRLWPFEYHYRWYFLHWLPRSILDLYVRQRYGHDFDLNLYTPWHLATLWRRFERYDYTLELIYNSADFFGVPFIPAWAPLVPRSLIEKVSYLLPNFNWILKKPVFTNERD
ncbi:MAG: methyltransferase domain-containing protein [Anaerolineae bacterium]